MRNHNHDVQPPPPRHVRVLERSWGTRTIETCECGAYRTKDVAKEGEIVGPLDGKWSDWHTTP